MIKYNKHDAWGNPTAIKDGAGNDVSGNASHIANINPFRYRGYYYDVETGFYYVQSRYYDPAMHRFLSMDDPSVLSVDQSSVMQYNLFAYCLNDPVNMVDSSGYYGTNRNCSFYGVVGWGIQITLNLTIGPVSGTIGLEFIWFFPQNNFGRGYSPWVYYFLGGSIGVSQASNVVNKILGSIQSIANNPKSLAYALNLSASFSISVFSITAKSIRNQNDYKGWFICFSSTALYVTISRASSPNGAITTYGAGVTGSIGISRGIISMGLQMFGYSAGSSYYWGWGF